MRDQERSAGDVDSIDKGDGMSYRMMRAFTGTFVVSVTAALDAAAWYCWTHDGRAGLAVGYAVAAIFLATEAAHVLRAR